MAGKQRLSPRSDPIRIVAINDVVPTRRDVLGGAETTPGSRTAADIRTLDKVPSRVSMSA